MTYFYIILLGFLALCANSVTANRVNGPCIVNGVAYPTLSKTPDPCDRCVCYSGTIVCNYLRCTREWMENLERLKDEGLIPRRPWDGTFDDDDLSEN